MLNETRSAILAVDGGKDLLRRLEENRSRILRDLHIIPWMSEEDAVHTAFAAHLEGRDGVRALRTLLTRWARNQRTLWRARTLATG